MGTARRELTDHITALDEEHLTRLLKDFIKYYHDDLCHLTLETDVPNTRAIKSRPDT